MIRCVTGINRHYTQNPVADTRSPQVGGGLTSAVPDSSGVADSAPMRGCGFGAVGRAKQTCAKAYSQQLQVALVEVATVQFWDNRSILKHHWLFIVLQPPEGSRT